MQRNPQMNARRLHCSAPCGLLCLRANRTLFPPLPSLSLSAAGSGINVSFDFGTLYLHLWHLNSRFKLQAHTDRHIHTQPHIQRLIHTLTHAHTLEHTQICITQRLGSTRSSSSYEIFISQSAVALVS